MKWINSIRQLFTLAARVQELEKQVTALDSLSAMTNDRLTVTRTELRAMDSLSAMTNDRITELARKVG